MTINKETLAQMTPDQRSRLYKKWFGFDASDINLLRHANSDQWSPNLRSLVVKDLRSKGFNKLADEIEAKGDGRIPLKVLPVPEHFEQVEWRQKAGRAYILIDDSTKVGFSRPDSLKRAIATQTIEYGYIPRFGFAGLVEGVDFEYVKKGIKTKEEIFMGDKAFCRVVYGSPSLWAAPDGFTTQEKLESRLKKGLEEFIENCHQAYYEHIEDLRIRTYQVLGFSPTTNGLWTIEREIRAGKPLLPTRTKKEQVEWEMSQGGYNLDLYLKTPEEIAANKLAIANNKPIRMRQRVIKIVNSTEHYAGKHRHITPQDFALLWQEVGEYLVSYKN